jgi:hypothetical protein
MLWSDGAQAPGRLCSILMRTKGCKDAHMWWNSSHHHPSSHQGQTTKNNSAAAAAIARTNYLLIPHSIASGHGDNNYIRRERAEESDRRLAPRRLDFPSGTASLSRSLDTPDKSRAARAAPTECHWNSNISSRDAATSGGLAVLSRRKFIFFHRL